MSDRPGTAQDRTRGLREPAYSPHSPSGNHPTGGRATTALPQRPSTANPGGRQPRESFGAASMRGTKNLRESQPLMPVGKVGFGANRSSFGRQTMSMNMSSASFSFDRVADRASKSKVYSGETMARHQPREDVPPPGAYNLAQSIGRQSLSTRPTMPSASFNRDSMKFSEWDRELRRTAATPAPGKYHDSIAAATSLGRRQVNASLSTAPRAIFERTTRDDRSRAFPGKTLQKHANYGRGVDRLTTSQDTLGFTSVGRQVGNWTTAPSFGFGQSTTREFHTRARSMTPGPGYYD